MNFCTWATSWELLWVKYLHWNTSVELLHLSNFTWTILFEEPNLKYFNLSISLTFLHSTLFTCIMSLELFHLNWHLLLHLLYFTWNVRLISESKKFYINFGERGFAMIYVIFPVSTFMTNEYKVVSCYVRLSMNFISFIT